MSADWTNTAHKYLQKVWTVESGLPQNTIRCMIQSHDGYLWIGSPAGLSRFDGLKFTVFDRHSNPPLKNDHILSLYESSDNILWIGTDGGGLYSFHNGILDNLTRRNGLSDDHVRAITGDWQGNLWVGTDYGLNCISGGHIDKYTIDDGLPDNIITALKVDNSGCLWAGTLQGGVVKIDHGAMRRYDAKDGLENLTIRAIHVDSKGAVWLGTLEGIYRLDQLSDLFERNSQNGLEPATAFMEEENERIWIATPGSGLKLIENGDQKTDHLTFTLPNDRIHCLLRDREGHLWIGTDTEGLIQLKRRYVQEITDAQGLPENGVSTLLEDNRGNLWIALRNGGLCKMTPDGELKIIDTKAGLFNKPICVLYQDIDGTLWCGTKDQGLYRLKKEELLHLACGDRLAASGITTLLRDSKNNLWIGSGEGLYSLQPGGIVKKEDNFLGHPKINILYSGRDQSVYAGTSAGVYRLRQETWQCLDSSLSADVLSLYQDEEGFLWIGTSRQGLKVYREKEITSFTNVPELSDNSILSIYLDDNDCLWISTYHGVIKINRQTLLHKVSNHTFTVYPCCFDENEGMPSRQCIGNVSPAVWRTRNGKLLYPTVKGIAVFDLTEVSDDTLSPEINFEKLMIDGVEAETGNLQTSTFTGKNYEIDFTAIDFSAPQKLRFEYMLEGLDTAFKAFPRGQPRQIFYSNLTAGRYKLFLRATNRRGLHNHKAAVITFHVRGPYYVHPVFIMLVMMFVLTASSVFFYYRYKRRVGQQLEKYKTSRLKKDISDKAKEKIEILMNAEKLYLNPDLNLQDLSSRLKLHPNYISRIINEQFHMSYNDFVNRHRIEEAKQKLADSEDNTKTILEIMYDTGFYSKSVFNSAFKKFTGMTPSEYRRNHA